MRYVIWCDECQGYIDASNTNKDYLKNVKSAHLQFHKGHHVKILPKCSICGGTTDVKKRTFNLHGLKVSGAVCKRCR